MSNLLIPTRNISAVTGSKFIDLNININGDIREQNILKEFLEGNITDFMRNFIPVNITSGGNSITYLVMNDYLSIGSDNDYVRMPMNPLTAQKIADQYDCTLPTRKMVLDIWKNSSIQLEPLPWGPPYDSSMMNTDRIKIHNQKIQKQLIGKDITKLISGHKKDVVISNTIAPNNPNKRVVIFGWIQKNGKPIQGLNYWSHEVTYRDYAHGIRLIANDVMINNSPARIQDIFTDATLCNLVSDEGALSFLKY
jgi:hypothetical protein